MKKSKGKFTRVRLEMFECSIYVISGCTAKEAAKILKKECPHVPRQPIDWLNDELNGRNQGVHLYDPRGFADSVIWVSKSLKEKRGVYLLTHEATHCAFRVMEHYSISVVNETQELLAVLVGFIVKKALNV